MTSPPPPSPPETWKLLAQGAEARIYLCPPLIGDEFSIVKERFSKKYRHPLLDEKLSKQRFNGEVRGMMKASKAGLDVPRIDFVDKARKRLVMEFVKGLTVKQYFENGEVDVEKKMIVAKAMGRVVGKLHECGMCHGDLTTSNLMMREGRELEDLTVIDFGLAFSTKSVEDMGVDL
jgi:TP53 regulating kinase-like protein